MLRRTEAGASRADLMAQAGDIYRIPAYRGDAPFAFVSYAHDDSATVFAELDLLAAQGMRFYYDEGIHPGHTWDDELAAAIQRCAVFVFFVTGRSVASPNCRREIAFALEHGKPVLAVHLEDADLPAGLKLSIGNRQAIVRSRFDEPRYRERLIAAIQEHLGDAREPVSASPAPTPMPPVKQRRRRWLSAVVALLAVAVGIVAMNSWRHAEADRRAHDEALAEVEQLVQQDRYGAAFTLAHPLIERDPARSDARLQALWKQIVVPGTPIVAEAGATLEYAAYDETNGGWISAGITPIAAPLDLPKGVVRIRLQKAGFQTAQFVVANPGPSVKLVQSLENDFLKTNLGSSDLALVLAPDGKLPNDMVLVPATDEPMYLLGLPDYTTGYDRRPLPEFAISKYEVTNREYKEFVDAGGYDKTTYWDGLEFRDEGKTLDWSAARARFVDRTGRPGPAGWELSAYPSGQADMPVGGISWYEAVAYARFRHLSLPTIHHWTRAAFGPFEGAFETAPAVAAASRFLADGPVEARREIGLGPWGTWNTAGNACEWVSNFVGTQAAVLGGCWSDHDRNSYKTLKTERPMARLPELGLRLMKSFAPVPDELLAPIPPPLVNAYATREPASDDAFAAMRLQFTVGARTPTDVQVTRFAESDTWTAEEVLLTYAKDDVLSVYVVLPRAHRAKPLQPILFGLPGVGILAPNRNVLEHLRTADVVVNGGRALVIPIWVDQYQRTQPATADLDAFTDRWRKRPTQYFQDGVRTIDYLATRSDMDAQRIGFMGISIGSIVIGPSLLAFESRIRTGVLLSAGLWVWSVPVEAPTMDMVNYAPRIQLPILMINGRYDSVLPYELSQLRLFDLLATPAADKRLVLFDVGHFTFPHSQLAREVNDWFDKYLGPVN